MLAAIRRASSRVISLVAARRPGSSSKIDIGERLTGLILHDETGFPFLDGHGGGKRRWVTCSNPLRPRA